MRALAFVVRFPAAGFLGGLTAIGVLELLNFTTAEEWEPTSSGIVLAYALGGALVGAAAGVLAASRRRFVAPRGTALRTMAWAAAVLYGPLLYERVYNAARFRFHALTGAVDGGGMAFAVAAGLIALAGYVLWIALLRRVARPGAGLAAPALAALTVAVAITLDRHVFPSALGSAALAVHFGLLVAALAMAVATRAPRAVRIATAGVLLCAALLASSFLARRGAPPQPVRQHAGPSPRPPDLVLVVIDTLRADVFEAVVRQTPEGRLLREKIGGAAWFSQAIAVSPWTLPSMGSIMTGRYPPEHGLGRTTEGPIDSMVLPLASEVPTLAEELRSAGYTTEAIGTNHFLNPRRTHIDRGFMRYEILDDEEWKFPLLRLLEWLGLVATESPYRDAGAVRRRLRTRLGELAGSDRPLFLWIHLMDPHAPLRAHGHHLGPDPAAAPLPELDRTYRDAVRYALAEVARMVDVLEEAGRWSNTLLVVTSDHGELLPSDGHQPRERNSDGTPRLYGHGHMLYDALLRVPLVMRPPGGLPADREVPVLVNYPDLHETLRSLLGVERDTPRADGVDLAGWLAPGAPADLPAPRAATIAGAPARGADQRALRTARYKLIQYTNGEFPPELYDLRADPGERNNIAAEAPDRLDRVASQLQGRWSALSVRESPVSEPIDHAARERLRALGYAD